MSVTVLREQWLELTWRFPARMPDHQFLTITDDIIAGEKQGYVDGRIDLPELEERIDMLIRHGDKIRADHYGATLRIEGADVDAYPVVFERSTR